MRLRQLVLVVAGLFLTLLDQAQAQNYPTRPIRLISPFAAGGANDVLARALGAKLADRLGASPGVATSQHLFAELFKVMTGTDLGHIPYNGTAPAVVDIVAGRVSLMFAAAAPSLPLIKEGNLKVLGVSSAERLAEAPDIPPIADAVPGFDVSNWSIILAPAGTPADIVNKLHGELKAVVASPDIQAQLAKIGMIPIDSPTPEALRSFVTTEVARWSKIVQQAGIAGAH